MDASGQALLIVGGRVIDPASGLDAVVDLAVRDGRVAEMGPSLSRSPADRVIDAEGLIVTPGLIDPHVHLREPGGEHKETIATGSAAAVAGGFTAVCCMPNTIPALDTPAMIELVKERAAAAGLCRVFPVAAATKGRKGETLAQIIPCREAGAVGFSDDGDVVESEQMMRRVFEAVKPTGAAFMQHCQDPALTVGASMHEGAVSLRLGLTGWPPIAEESIIERDVRLNTDIGCPYHVQHVSSGGSIPIIRAAREAGLPVTAEASPHHLILTDDACDGFNTGAKMNPPLRTRADVEALRQAVAEGVITVLATDHAPHSADEKARPFELAPFGIIGLETALPLCAEALVATGAIDWPRLIWLMTVGPAALCGLDAMGLGRLEVGGPADVTLIDPDAEWTVAESDLRGRSSNTPFLGRRVRGRAVGTIVGGRLVHELTTGRAPAPAR